MIIKEVNRIKYLQFSNLSEFKNITHFSTTRLSGKSEGKLSSFNLGYTVNDNPRIVTSNLDSLANLFGFERSQMVSPKQTHSKNIGIVKSIHDIFPDTDALKKLLQLSIQVGKALYRRYLNIPLRSCKKNLALTPKIL